MAERFERAVERKILAEADAPGQAAVFPRRDLVGIAWEPFSRRRLEEFVNSGKTVFVNFTADWCLTCKANEAAAIERPEVARLIRENGVVALRADKTSPAPEVDETLHRLGNKAASIPFYAIFPGNSSIKPILLDGLLTNPGPIMHAVRQAGPSRARDRPTRHGRPSKLGRVGPGCAAFESIRDSSSSMEVVRDFRGPPGISCNPGRRPSTNRLQLDENGVCSE